MANTNNALDFLNSGEVDIEQVAKYLISRGFEIIKIEKPSRHVIAFLRKDAQRMLFKMASRSELNVYISNQIAWQKLNIDLGGVRMPNILDQGNWNGLEYLIEEYVDGVDAKEAIEVFESKMGDFAKAIVNISKFRPLDLPLDLSVSGVSLEHILESKLSAYKNNIKDQGERLFEYLSANMSDVVVGTARGDLGLANIKITSDGVLWLIDNEFASGKNCKFYDLAYFYYRLYVDANNKDLANRFEDSFLKLYGQMNEGDKKAYKWITIYRLVGGINESLGNDDNLSRIKELENKVLG